MNQLDAAKALPGSGGLFFLSSNVRIVPRNPKENYIFDFTFDYLVNYAVGIRTLGEMNLAERTVYYFRERVYQYCLENPGKDDLLFGQFIKLHARQDTLPFVPE